MSLSSVLKLRDDDGDELPASAEICGADAEEK